MSATELITSKDFSCPCCSSKGTFRANAEFDGVACVVCRYTVHGENLRFPGNARSFVDYVVVNAEKHARQYFWMLRMRRDIHLRRTVNHWATASQVMRR